MLLPAALRRVSCSIGPHNRCHYLSQAIPIVLRQVLALILGKDGQEEERHGGIVVVVDDPHPPAFPTRADAPATLSDTTCPNHDCAIFRMARNEGDELLP